MGKILLVVQRLWRGGGTETHVLTLALSLIRRGHSVGVFTSGGPWVARFRAKGIPVYVGNGKSFAIGLAQGSSKLTSLIEQKGYRIIHAHDAPSFNLIHRTLTHYKRKGRIRVVMTVHGPYVNRRSIRRLAGRAAGVIIVSPELRSHVLAAGVAKKRVFLIANGIDMSVFHPRLNKSSLRRREILPQKAFVVGYAGRFSFDKTILSRRISHIICQYAARQRGVYALIAGRNAKNHLVTRKTCRIVGHRSDMQNFYNTCDAVVGTARVALESMASATPTIAVGHARYIGILSRRNIGKAFQTNFGDHGPVRSAWKSSRLVRDLHQVRKFKKTIQRETDLTSHQVRRSYSTTRLARQIEQVYGI